MTREPIGIAMSGGVDSTAAALLLKERFAVEGFFMDLAQPDFEDQKRRVVHLAEALNIPLHIIDLKVQFKKRVLDYFTGSYFQGRTPNPCMICNLEIKFGLFMDAILSSGMAAVATGHYARIHEGDGEFFLKRGTDVKKDQSYFLSRLTQQQLSRVMFPLGSAMKEDIYRFVENNGYTDFRGVESQDICFLKNKRVRAFLEEYKTVSIQPGNIISVNGSILGRHKGLHCYTIGQRRGLGLPDATPWYVCSLDQQNNTLVVGKNRDLFSSALTADNPHWISRAIPEANRTYTVRIRYSHPGAEARFTWVSGDSFRLDFDEAQRAIAPGQYAVLYDGTRVVGSGEIVSRH
ncbi:MAG: tRNA 2-thiouridine(34) synthase MnmA [Desulfocapsaceae bacterium]|nr:tRNA 2-thiouridine(34) synthase MnmA [Desulfocapsaceae bacterium]